MISAEAVLQHLLSSLRIGDTLARYGKNVLAHVMGAFVLMAVGLLMVIFAVAYASWSGYIAAQPVMGAAWASLLVAVMLLLVAAGFFVGGAFFIQRDPRPRAPKPPKGPAPAAGIAGLPFSVEDAELIVRLLKDRVEDDPIAATVVSLCSGYISGSVLFRK